MISYYIISLGSNCQEAVMQLELAKIAINKLGPCNWSECFEFPDRKGDAVPNYINQVGILKSSLNLVRLKNQLKNIEQSLGRGSHPPSKQGVIPIDIDLIGSGPTPKQFLLLSKRLPLPYDVIKPLQQLL